jgi:3-dehydroquinate dehydratase/shikimate dehydrogenase
MDDTKSKICVPLGASRLDELRSLAKRASGVADIIELRLDYLAVEELEKLSSRLPALIQSLSLPVILTFRAEEQGGKSKANLEERLSFWRWARHSPAAFFDFELDLALALKDDSNIDWKRVICSHHDFDKTPDCLEKIYETIATTPARIIKIATQANDITDCIAIFRLLERAKKEGRDLIALAMGESGKITRIIGPMRGSFLTYGAIDEESGTAPGQISATDLRELYRINRIGPQTKIIGIVGQPVSHSLSPRIHNAAFEARGVDAVYLPLDAKDVSAFLRRMVHAKTKELDWNLRGLSVTAPHKRAALDHLDWIDETAKEIGAVNTIVVEGERLLGYNTDALGFIEPLKNVYGSLRDARCALIGAGGAARAALYALKTEGARVTVFARYVEKAQNLAEEFESSCVQLVGASFAEFDIVINTTPLGTVGEFENETPATAEQLQGSRLVYDLVYNPSITLFMSEAQKVSVPTIGGLQMLVAQAMEQFKLWTNLDVPADVMMKAAS